MARLARVEVFAADEVANVHVMNRVVRRCFLMGDGPLTGKNYDHRKEWLEDDSRATSHSRPSLRVTGASSEQSGFHLSAPNLPPATIGLVPIRRNRFGMLERWTPPARQRRSGLPRTVAGFGALKRQTQPFPQRRSGSSRSVATGLVC